ncbi:MAG: sll0787 family AIR synthase-like protein [Deltaproteobacteria bacterium]
MQNLISSLRASPRISHKMKLQDLWRVLPRAAQYEHSEILLGDDAAAIKTQDRYLLLAAEGVYPPLLKSNPYLAGRTSVLTNISDIYAMGGRPIALVDVLFTSGDGEASEALRGIRDNASRYGVPLVGGHLTQDTGGCSSLAVAILGEASRLLSSFAAQVDDDLVYVSNFNGSYYSSFNFWDSSSALSDADARCHLELFPQIAEQGLADAAKDVSMAGIAGTTLMLLECSGRGAEIYIDKIPSPKELPLAIWLLAFPSYGFILSLRPSLTERVRSRFHEFGLVSEVIGRVTEQRRVYFVRDCGERAVFWDFTAEPLIGINADLAPTRTGGAGLFDGAVEIKSPAGGEGRE